MRHLDTPEARARIDGEQVRVFAPRKGVSLQVGVLPLAALRRLESDGAVARCGGRAIGWYALTPAGQARARREATPGPETFQRQHRDVATLADPADAGVAISVNIGESPLLWLYRRGNGLIGEAEFAAGERLRADMTLAQTLPRLTADLERPASSGFAGALDPGEARLAAAQRVTATLQAVGPEFSGVLVDVCGFLKGLEEVERERGWPARSAKLVLSLALAALARQYGLSNAAVGAPGRRRRHAWGAGDYRPEFPALPAVTPPPSAPLS